MNPENYGVGDWLVTDDGEVVARGKTMEEAIQLAADVGWKDSYLLQMVSPVNLVL